MYHVAVCEDEAVLRRELCGQCEAVLAEMQVAHRVTAFSSAEELEAALASGETFSLLCLDILMGGKNGMELARELRAREDETSILFITGSTEFLKDGYSVRPIQYLLKPVEPEALRRAIDTDLRLHHRPAPSPSARGAGRWCCPSGTFSSPKAGITAACSTRSGENSFCRFL